MKKEEHKLEKELDKDIKKANGKFIGLLEKIQSTNKSYWITIVIVVILLGTLFGILAGTKVI